MDRRERVVAAFRLIETEPPLHDLPMDEEVAERLNAHCGWANGRGALK